MVVEIDGAPLPVRPSRLSWRRTPGERAMEARARRRVEKGRKTDLFKLMNAARAGPG